MNAQSITIESSFTHDRETAREYRMRRAAARVARRPVHHAMFAATCALLARSIQYVITNPEG